MIQQLKEKIDKEVTICGWVHILRNQGGIRFIIVRDITGFIQVVVSKEKNEAFNLATIIMYNALNEKLGNL